MQQHEYQATKGIWIRASTSPISHQVKGARFAALQVDKFACYLADAKMATYDALKMRRIVAFLEEAGEMRQDGF